MDAIEQTIRNVASRRLGAIDATVARTFDRNADVSLGGVWFCLGVRLPGECEPVLLGRRRTKQELLALVSTLAPQHVNGKSFF